MANIDAAKAAVLFVLLGGTDPLLQTPDEKIRFSYIEGDFFEGDNHRQYIAWEATSYENRVKMESSNSLKIEKYFKINRCILSDYLASRAILEKKDEVLLQMPFIAVLPNIDNEKDAVGFLDDNPNYHHGATVIESYLTALGYDVDVPRQKLLLDEIADWTRRTGDAPTDNAYVIANAIGTDIYIKFNLETSEKFYAGNQVRRVTSNVRAYETTTNRLLGSETGYSAERPASEFALIEESLNDAVGKVLSRINSYWKNDLKRGIQYKLMFSFDPVIPEPQKEELSFIVIDILNREANVTKELVSTGSNMDYLVWVNPEKITSLTDLYRILKKELTSTMTDIELRKISLNRKMAMLSITK